MNWGHQNAPNDPDKFHQVTFVIYLECLYLYILELVQLLFTKYISKVNCISTISLRFGLTDSSVFGFKSKKSNTKVAVFLILTHMYICMYVGNKLNFSFGLIE